MIRERERLADRWRALLRRADRPVPSWALVVTALLVALTAGYGIGRLDIYAEEWRQAELVLAQIDAHAHQLTGLVDRVASTGHRDARLLRQVDEVRGKLGRGLDQLERLRPDDAPTRTVLAEAQAFRLAADASLQLAAADRFEAALAASAARIDPSFERLHTAVSGAAAGYRAAAYQANVNSRAGSVVMMVLAGLLIGLLVWRADRARRLAELVATEQRALQGSEERLRALVQHTRDIIALVDPGGIVRYVNPAVEQVLGVPPEQVVGTSMVSWLHPDDVARGRTMFHECLNSTGVMGPVELRCRHVSGEWRTVESTVNNLLATPSVGAVVVAARDITERQALLHRLSYQAFYDSLTGLPNRALFMDHLDLALAQARRRPAPVAVMFLDLDDFKVINDSLGHRVGDTLLRTVGQRLATCVRDGDTVARLGGDEFTVLLPAIATIHEAEQVAERILEHLCAPFSLEGHELFVRTSIGIAISTPDTDGPDELLRNADLAMYAAKLRGKTCYEVFEPGMNARAWERLELEAELRRAIQEQEFRLHYQPVIDLATGRICEVEALVRWQHPRRGLLAPAEFIAVAETTGLILPLGQWVLETATRQMAAWQACAADGPITLCVNLSARQFRQPALVAKLAGILTEAGLAPGRLKLEITESLTMENVADTLVTLRELKELGVQLAIDDFGTGYSSLSYLKHFPIDCLKIDRSFVSQLGIKQEDTAIVQAVLAFAAALNLAVTAEGIETAGQVAHLTALGCAQGQGYYFAHPLPPEEMSDLLTTIPTWADVLAPAPVDPALALLPSSQGGG